MKSTEEEQFALTMVFSGPDPVSLAIRAQLNDVEVVARETTGVGFFSAIHTTHPLPVDSRKQWDWNFMHRHMPYGGAFMCWIEDSNDFVLEAVAHMGEWPDRFEAADFNEA